MSEPAALAVFADNVAVALFLKDVVRAAGFAVTQNLENAAAILATEEQAVPPGARNILRLGSAAADAEGVRVIKTPLRAAELVAILKRTVAAQANLPVEIPFAGGVLNTRDNLWQAKDREPVRLTEKETAILAYLKESDGEPVSREALLSYVWSYADTVETHTLETHIYRLRQKIEPDPSNPVILITMDDGYSAE